MNKFKKEKRWKTVTTRQSENRHFKYTYILLKACSKGHFGNNCNETCDGCISELFNSSDGVCDIEDMCKAEWYGVKCDKGICIILYKY